MSVDLGGGVAAVKNKQQATVSRLVDKLGVFSTS